MATSKALKLLGTVGAIIPDPTHPETFLVKGSSTRYRVQVLHLDEGVNRLTCTCQHGQVYGASAHCYHVEAVQLHLNGAPLA